MNWKLCEDPENPTVVVSANGKVEKNDEAQVYVDDFWPLRDGAITRRHACSSIALENSAKNTAILVSGQATTTIDQIREYNYLQNGQFFFVSGTVSVGVSEDAIQTNLSPLIWECACPAILGRDKLDRGMKCPSGNSRDVSETSEWRERDGETRYAQRNMFFFLWNSAHLEPCVCAMSVRHAERMCVRQQSVCTPTVAHMVVKIAWVRIKKSSVCEPLKNHQSKSILNSRTRNIRPPRCTPPIVRRRSPFFRRSCTVSRGWLFHQFFMRQGVHIFSVSVDREIPFPVFGKPCKPFELLWVQIIAAFISF